MSKKRFSIKYNTASTNYPTGRVFDNEKQHTLYIDEVVNLLNWLINENKELKEERNYFERKKCEYFNKYNKKHLDNIQLKEENEQLKKEIKSKDKIIEVYYEMVELNE